MHFSPSITKDAKVERQFPLYSHLPVHFKASLHRLPIRPQADSGFRLEVYQDFRILGLGGCLPGFEGFRLLDVEGCLPLLTVEGLRLLDVEGLRLPAVGGF